MIEYPKRTPVLQLFLVRLLEELRDVIYGGGWGRVFPPDPLAGFRGPTPKGEGKGGRES